MKLLEEYFGQPLFDRSARQVQPTPFALEVASTFQQSLDLIESLRSRDTPSVLGRIRLGTVESVQVSMLPLVVRALRESAPQLELLITRGVSAHLLCELKAGRLDAAVLVQPQTGGSSRLCWTVLAREPFVMIAPPGSTGHTASDLLRSYPYIGQDRLATGGKIAAQFVEKIAPRSRQAFELPGTDAIAAMVSEGLGVSIVPYPRDSIFQTYPLRVIDLGRHAPTRQIAFASRTADADNRRVQAVLQAFELATKP